MTKLQSDLFTVESEPEAMTYSAKESAVIVVDMQNAYASEGGYCDLAGFDISGSKSVISNIRAVVDLARSSGLQIVFLQNGWDPDYLEAGTSLSPNYHKSNALKTMRRRPELSGHLLARGTWDYNLVDDLKPEPGDLCVHKTRYSAFFNTQLDSLLRARGIKNLFLVGIATNVCVESTLRDGFHLEYFCTLIEGATHHLGPQPIHDASIYNITTFFGWVTSVSEFTSALSKLAD